MSPTEMSWVRWIELWFFQLMPVLFYLGTVYYAYALYHKPVFTHDYWHWSFLWMMLAVVGAMLLRVQAIVFLWQGGRAHAWEWLNFEQLVASWCVGMGLLVHAYLLYKHPIWSRRVNMTSQPSEPPDVGLP